MAIIFKAFTKSRGLKSSPSLQQVYSPCSLLWLLQVLLLLAAPGLTARLGRYSSNWPLEYAAGQPYGECRTFPRSLPGLVYMDSLFPL